MDIVIKEIEKKTICLNMIVKNEAHIICQTFDNLTKFFDFDYYVICDTGSTDGTQKKIVEYFEKIDISGEIHECKWKDFGHNRTEALEKAYNKTDYLFIFDADDKITGNFKLPSELVEDTYHLQFGDCNGGFVYKRPLLLNNRKKYKYEGVLHEFLVPIDHHPTEKLIKGNYGVHSGRTGDRSKDPDKYKKDAKILEDAFYNKENEGLKHRYAFYCGQSYKDCGNIDKAIEWYEKTLTLKNWNQEKYYSSLQLGFLYKQKNEIEKALFYWLKTMEYDNDRIEGVVLACAEYSSRGMHQMVTNLYNNFKGYKSIKDNLCEKLFVDTTRYNNLLEFYCSASAQHVGNSKLGYEACKEFLITNTQSTHITLLLLYNFQFYMQYYSDDLDLELFYSVDNIISKFDNIEDRHIKIWNFMFDKIKHKLTQKKELLDFPSNPIKCKKPWIIITFTTCKRFDLFKQTLNSILNNWEDYNKIDYWFCVDDNSSKEDREKMKEQFPWIDYYMKDLNEKGHRKSMNIIWEKLNTLKPKYWIHMEDDFLFHKKMPYIKKGIEGLTKFKNENIKQILFNRNYAEIISGYKIKGHKKLSDEFSIHDHNHEQHSYPNCHYWPHHSFRPAIIDVETILSLGNFDSENHFFEMDYAKRWYNRGFVSGFFNFITNKHIGRLTSERNDTSKFNAYALNNESQFMKKPPYVKIINLKRRKDRKQKTNETLKNDNIDYEFIEAVDGKTLEPTLELKELFAGNDFGNRRGVIGCALSHYKLWKQLLDDKDNEFYLIMEDDFTPCKDFNQKLESIKSEFSKKELIFLGYSMFEKERNKVKDIYNSEESGINIQTLNKNLYIGGFFSYTINKAGAQFLIDYINNNGIKHGIDYLIKISDVSAYECVPQLFFSEWNEDCKEIDTDIQTDYTSIDFSKIKDDFIFLPHLDQIGNDFHYNRTSLLEMKDRALKNNNCVAFNTLGYFKNKIDKLTSSKYFGSTDGIYVKKEYYENKELYIQKYIHTKNNFINLNKDSVYICGCVKNCATHRDKVFKNIKTLTENFKNSEIIIAYDNSNDSSLKKINNFSEELKNEKSVKFKLIKNNNNSCHIVENICSARNSILEYIRTKSNKYEYMIMMDMDDVCSEKIKIKKLKKYLNNSNWDCLTFNKKEYYDIWALSIDKFKLSCWHWENNQVAHIMRNYITKKLKTNELIECDSAFNGFAIYRLNKFINNVYKSSIYSNFKLLNNNDIKNNETILKQKFNINKLNADLDCEHKYFHLKAKQDGCKIKISPEILFDDNDTDDNDTDDNDDNNDIDNIKEIKTKNIRVKMLCNWCSSEQLCKEWSTMADNSFIWNNIELTWESSNIDYYVIINKPPENEYFVPEKTIVFQMEPWIYNVTKDWGVHTWGKWSIPDEKKFLYVGRHKNSLNNVQWQIAIPHVIPEVKDRLDKAFTCLSEKNFDLGHKKRIEFLKSLEKRKQGKTDLIDIYGRENYHSLNHYKGPLKDDKKENHFIDYKYCFAVENNSERNYATEKIWEPILCECLCFYWGCPNLKDYINEKAFVQLDMNDFEKSYEIIKKAIKEDWWSQRIDIIRAEKKKLLNEMGFFPTLDKIIKNNSLKENPDIKL